MIFFMLGSLAAGEEVCPKYTCGELSKSECVVASGEMVYVQSCPKGFYCDRQRIPLSSYCEEKVESEEFVWPGESCDAALCAYGYCNGTHCVGQGHDETCLVSDECEPGLFCKDGTCKHLLRSGEKGCRNDFDCEYAAGCMRRKCVRYFSLRESEFVHCVSNRSEFCRSGSCYDKYCLSYLQNDNGEGIQCQSKEDCVNTMYSMDIYPFPFYTECKCGFNGNKYCQLFPGDVTMRRYRRMLLSYIHSGRIELCNTARRFEPKCIKSVWTNQRYTRLLYYKYLASSNTEVNNTDSCVLKAMHPEYFELHESSQSFSSFLHYTLALIILNTT